MADIPLDVMMRGPGAVAAWLADKDAEDDRKASRLAQMQVDVLKSVGIDANVPGKLTGETFALAMGACAQVAVLIAYAAKDGMRGPARDSLSEVIDACFDVIEGIEEEVPALRAILEKMRARK